MACAKHYAVHSGPESKRHRFDAEPPERDFYETYLPHFEMAVREGSGWRRNGRLQRGVWRAGLCQSATAHGHFAQAMGFLTVTSFPIAAAIEDISAHHHFANSPEEGAAAAVKAGCDICCGGRLQRLAQGAAKRFDHGSGN